jgi:hypothetical protein
MSLYAMYMCQYVTHQNSRNRASDIPEARVFDPGHGFSIASMHVVDPLESLDVHLVVVTSAGFRIYIDTGMRAAGEREVTRRTKNVLPPYTTVFGCVLCSDASCCLLCYSGNSTVQVCRMLVQFVGRTVCCDLSCSAVRVAYALSHC